MDDGVGAPLRDLAQRWIAEREQRGELQGRSSKVESSRLESFLQAAGDDATRLDVGKELVMRWQERIGHLAPATRRSYVSTASKFCRWLAEEHGAGDVSRHFGKVREPRRAPRALRRRDVDRILEACVTDRQRMVTWLMVGMGLRCVEVSRLNVDDYDPDARTLFVRGKGGHERVLPVPADVAEAVEEYLTGRGWRQGPLVIGIGSKTDPSGRVSARWISKSMARLMKKAGVHEPGDRKTAHALRHTCATDVLQSGAHLRLVQQMLGHASLQTTEIYLAAADMNQLRGAMEGRQYGAHRHVGAGAAATAAITAVLLVSSMFNTAGVAPRRRGAAAMPTPIVRTVAA